MHKASGQTDERAPTTSADLAAHGDLTELVTAIFHTWNSRGIAFLVLRNYEALPASTSNDIDVLVSPRHVAQAERAMLMAATRAGYTVHNRVKFSPTAYFFFHRSSQRQVHLDLFSSVHWHCLPMLSVEPVLAARRGRGLFFTADPVDEAIISLLTRVIYTGRVKESHKPNILGGFRNAPEKARITLANIVGDQLAGQCVACVIAERWTSVERCCTKLRRALIWRQLTRHPWNTLNGVISSACRVMERLVHPPGITVALLTTDGNRSGTGERLVNSLHSTFSPDKGLHRKRVMFHPAGSKVVLPAAQSNGSRGRFGSVLARVGHWMESLFASRLQCRLALFRNGLVLIDEDCATDHARDQLGVGQWIVSRASRVARKADLVFLLDSPPEALRVLAQETSPTEPVWQREAYRRAIATLPNCTIVDATQPVERMVAQITGRVLDWMAERVTGQYGDIVGQDTLKPEK
jgi:hypothetical protein